MNNEKIEDYQDGKVVNRSARGNTAEKKRQISDQNSLDHFNEVSLHETKN
jgi:hypothetical protein